MLELNSKIVTWLNNFTVFFSFELNVLITLFTYELSDKLPYVEYLALLCLYYHCPIRTSQSVISHFLVS
jgi:hypothetical protein